MQRAGAILPAVSWVKFLRKAVGGPGDDHSRNFSYLYQEKERRWVLSPAYDLTYSSSIGGEHATSVHGNGADPGMTDLLAVADGADIDGSKARRIAEDIRECTHTLLKEYLG